MKSYTPKSYKHTQILHGTNSLHQFTKPSPVFACTLPGCYPGYSWLAEQMDLTGARGSAVFLGANAGWLVTTPLAGR